MHRQARAHAVVGAGLLTACTWLYAEARAAELEVNVGALTHAQSAYLESCGGCHGLQGISARGLVPDLRDRVGYWMCTAQGREYIVRLPNVAFADRSDQELADLLNFVVFGFGGTSVQKGAKPYTADEVRALRSGASPIITDLKARRRAVMRQVRKACALPARIGKSAPGY